jgi:hypothetical protein
MTAKVTEISGINKAKILIFQGLRGIYRESGNKVRSLERENL